MKVLTVCGMGMGTSLMLLMEIQSVAKKHGIAIEGEAVDLGSAKGRTCDLIVASAEIANELSDVNAEIVGIKNIIDRVEIEQKIMPVIQNIINRGK